MKYVIMNEEVFVEGYEKGNFEKSSDWLHIYRKYGIKKEESEINYKEEIIEHINKETEDKEDTSSSESDTDDLLDEAIKIVVEYNQASTSFLQRRLRVGFNRASRIMEQLEERGIISERDGTKPRQVLLTKNDLVRENESEQ